MTTSAANPHAGVDPELSPTDSLLSLAASLDREADWHLREATAAEARATQMRTAAARCTRGAQSHRDAAAALATPDPSGP